MLDPDQDPRPDAKLQNLSDEEHEVLWRFRHPEKGGKKLKLDAILVEIPLRYGFTVALSTLSDFYRWLAFRRRIAEAKRRANQAKAELANDPSITPEELDRVAQIVFTSEATENLDIKGYVALAKLRLAKEKHSLERQKLELATKTKLEAGLDALLGEIQGNDAAMKIWKQLKEVLAQ
ncbi:hypothetical protein [Luteolibacter sp. LG18]|uniref:hypothetical protein n=1 Tax=Luteolibacter sp. LG18 TaxID=2819286 RepID=UPI002B2FDAC8|nr:hypothetical protein llg_07120 [Luteolibacter sp. LG18]BCU79659.1 hypothetical protein llg_43740 [Luteolibacter sp. LG18]